MEVLLLPTSDLVGKTVQETRFRTRSGLTVVGLRHGLVARESNLLNEVLAGATRLLIGPWKDIKKPVRRQRSCHNQAASRTDEVLEVPGKAPHALACLAPVVGLMVSGLVLNVQAALIGCLLMGALGCIDLVMPTVRSTGNHRPHRRHAAVFNRSLRGPAALSWRPMA